MHHFDQLISTAMATGSLAKLWLASGTLGSHSLEIKGARQSLYLSWECSTTMLALTQMPQPITPASTSEHWQTAVWTVSLPLACLVLAFGNCCFRTGDNESLSSCTMQGDRPAHSRLD